MNGKYIVRSAAALGCILSLLLALASCVEKPQTDTTSDWEGKENFKVEDKFDEKLIKRYDEYKINDIISPEGENVMGEEYMEFYLDEEKLDEMIVRLFYAPKK